MPEHEGEGEASEASGSLAAAIKTILMADLVMSLDNVIAVAAAAKGSVTLLIVGLAISIPLVVFASTMLLNLMNRFPIIITIGAALLGWVAGEMAISDPAVKEWVDAQMPYLHYVAPRSVPPGWSRWASFSPAARKPAAGRGPGRDACGPGAQRSGVRRILLAVDGSEHSRKAIEQVLALGKESRDPRAIEIHLANVQPGCLATSAASCPRTASRASTTRMPRRHLKIAREMLQQCRAGLQGARGRGPCRGR